MPSPTTRSASRVLRDSTQWRPTSPPEVRRRSGNTHEGFKVEEPHIKVDAGAPATCGALKPRFSQQPGRGEKITEELYQLLINIQALMNQQDAERARRDRERDRERATRDRERDRRMQELYDNIIANLKAQDHKSTNTNHSPRDLKTPRNLNKSSSQPKRVAVPLRDGPGREIKQIDRNNNFIESLNIPDVAVYHGRTLFEAESLICQAEARFRQMKIERNSKKIDICALAFDERMSRRWRSVIARRGVGQTTWEQFKDWLKNSIPHKPIRDRRLRKSDRRRKVGGYRRDA